MPQQTAETAVDTYKARIAKLQEAMKEFNLRAVVMDQPHRHGAFSIHA